MTRIAVGLVAVLCIGSLPAPAAEICMGPSAATGENGSIGCVGPPDSTTTNDWIGYNTEGASCYSGAGGSECYYGCPDPPYHYACWSISSSITDPFETSGAIGSYPAHLYVWLVNSRGLGSAAFALTGDLQVIEFTPMNGVVSTGPPDQPDELQLSVVGCPSGPMAVGRITVEEAVGVGAPGEFESVSWGRVRAMYR